MWATMKALNMPSTRDITLWELPWITASYAISVVAGFGSMLPGGVGVRELVIRELVAPNYGQTAGILAAILHRMTTLVARVWSYPVRCSLTRQRSPVPVEPPPEPAR